MAPNTHREKHINIHFILYYIALGLDSGRRNWKYKYVSEYLRNYSNPFLHLVHGVHSGASDSMPRVMLSNVAAFEM